MLLMKLTVSDFIHVHYRRANKELSSNREVHMNPARRPPKVLLGEQTSKGLFKSVLLFNNTQCLYLLRTLGIQVPRRQRWLQAHGVLTSITVGPPVASRGHSRPQALAHRRLRKVAQHPAVPDEVLCVLTCFSAAPAHGNWNEPWHGNKPFRN